MVCDDTAGPQSCPFVYSYDGENYIFDAEPLGGAISEGLKKTDYSRLEHLKGVEGKYHLFLRNELEETQYTDAIKLLEHIGVCFSKTSRSRLEKGVKTVFFGAG